MPTPGLPVPMRHLAVREHVNCDVVLVIPEAGRTARAARE